MVYNREEAARRAEAQTTNTPGTCQLWTRTMFGAPSVGDVDRDGDADAVDGWLSEPPSARRTDKNPPRGVPVAWAGGSKGYGHRAVSLGGGRIRSTDMKICRYNRGTVGTATIDQITTSMGLRYLGWSTTISGIHIPLGPTAPKEPHVPKRPAAVRAELARLRKVRDNLIEYRDTLPKGSTQRKRVTRAIKRVRRAIRLDLMEIKPR